MRGITSSLLQLLASPRGSIPGDISSWLQWKPLGEVEPGYISLPAVNGLRWVSGPLCSVHTVPHRRERRSKTSATPFQVRDCLIRRRMPQELDVNQSGEVLEPRRAGPRPLLAQIGCLKLQPPRQIELVSGPKRAYRHPHHRPETSRVSAASGLGLFGFITGEPVWRCRSNWFNPSRNRTFFVFFPPTSRTLSCSLCRYHHCCEQDGRPRLTSYLDAAASSGATG